MVRRLSKLVGRYTVGEIMNELKVGSLVRFIGHHNSDREGMWGIVIKEAEDGSFTIFWQYGSPSSDWYWDGCEGNSHLKLLCE